jgi:hypothetical protein
MKEQVSLRTLAQPGGLLRMLSSRLLRNWLGDGSGSSVPEGLTDRSLAIYCQEPHQRDSVPEGTV